MDRYFYLISQLPMLFFEKETTLTPELFLEEAEKWLSRRRFQSLIKIHLGETSTIKEGYRLWREIREFEYQFRTELAHWREFLITDKEYKPRTFPLSLVREGNPLEIEKKVLAYRWKKIESLELGHHFDFELLILYYLKLQILRRLSQFNKEKGMEEFKRIVKIEKEEQTANRVEAIQNDE